MVKNNSSPRIGAEEIMEIKSDNIKKKI